MEYDYHVREWKPKRWVEIVWETVSPFVWLGVVGVLALFASQIVYNIPKPSFASLDQAIQQQLSVGTAWQEVQAFLARNEFQHSEQLTTLTALDRRAALGNPGGTKLKRKEERLAYSLTGYRQVANWKPELLCGCGRMHVEFYFDAQGRLIDYVAYEYGDGP